MAREQQVVRYMLSDRFAQRVRKLVIIAKWNLRLFKEFGFVEENGSVICAVDNERRLHMFFGLAGGFGAERIVGPVVLFILSAELFFDLMIGVFPEAVQVSGHLHRTVCR